MLVQDYCIDYVLERYASFVSSLTWFRMYCVGKMGNDKSDYLEAFKSLKSDFEDLYDYDEKRQFYSWKEQLRTKLISDIEKILKLKRFTDDHIQKISTIVWEFQKEKESTFRSGFLDKEVKWAAKSDYPEELHRAVNDLIDSGSNEEAVLQAFKFLDNYMQKLLSVPPHKLYGEELINYAFSPNSGVLQLGTHQNEQVGLRNFFSGANALLRNPSAHRFIHYDDFDAAAIVAMVTMMTNLISKLAKPQIPKKKSKK